MAFCVFYWGNCEGNFDGGAVLAYANGFEMIDALTTPEALKNSYFLVLTIMWNYQFNILADGFFGGVAEQPLGTFIPTADHAIESLADDGVVGGIYDSGK